jgi:hypothetical protein
MACSVNLSFIYVFSPTNFEWNGSSSWNCMVERNSVVTYTYHKVSLHYNTKIITIIIIIIGSRASIVGIATGYGLDDWKVGVRVPVGSRIFSTSSRPALGPTQPLIKWVPGALSPGLNRPGSEADHSPSTSAEVRKVWIYMSTPPCAFMA